LFLSRFVKVPQIKEQLLANNMKTYWVPEVVRDKRFHNWLTEARDWNISRNRYWGTPLPIWQNEDGTERVIIGSIEELSKLSGVQNITDLHKDSIDHITIPAPSGRGVLKRVPEVFDCWFESGSMPYGQKHYPFENKAKFEASFPADFIAEGLDQTRGWFYTLMVISTALFDQPAFKNLIVNGLVLAADGKKMSKRLKNYPDPMLIVDNYGADALRVYLINSPVVRAEKLEFKEPGVFNVVKDLMVPWFNSYRLFCEQARRHGSKTNAPFQYSPAQVAGADNVVDRWILASLQSLITFVKKEMEAYRLYTVIPRLLGFVNSLSKWYIRFQKERLKGDHGDLACASSLAVFFEVLYTLCILMAPITPFFVEFMYLNLRFALPASQRMDSVHFLMMPQADESKSNAQVERGMECLQSVIELGFKAREKSGVSLRVPLPSVTICHRDQNFLDQVQALESYVRTQLKVNDVKYNKDFTSMVKFEAAPDRRALGQSLLGNMKAAMTQIMALSQEELIAMESRGSLTLTCNGEEVTIPANDIKLICHFSGDSKVFCPVTEGGLLVMLTRTPDEACLEEGLAREFISRVQRLRKEAKLNSESKVRVLYRLNPESAPKLHACLVNRHALVLEGLRVSALAEHATPSVPEGLVHATQEDNIAAEPFVTWILNA
jgi:isoleucyl-tRNA synthetase